MRYKNLYEVVKYLKKTILMNYDIFVMRTKLKKTHDGECICLKNKFIIKINKNLSESHSIDVMLHEASHVLSWDKEKDQHGIAWGIAYSKIYRKFLEWLEEN